MAFFEPFAALQALPQFKSPAGELRFLGKNH